MTIALVVLGGVVYVGVGMAFGATAWDGDEGGDDGSLFIAAFWPAVAVAYVVAPFAARLRAFGDKK